MPVRTPLVGCVATLNVNGPVPVTVPVSVTDAVESSSKLTVPAVAVAAFNAGRPPKASSAEAKRDHRFRGIATGSKRLPPTGATCELRGVIRFSSCGLFKR